MADSIQLTRPDPLPPAEPGPLHQQILDLLSGGGAYFFRQLAHVVAPTSDGALAAVIWDLAWAGLISNDTFGPLRALVSDGHATHRSPNRSPRVRLGGRARIPLRAPASPAGMGGRSTAGPPGMVGRWALLPSVDPDPTRRSHAVAEGLLDRHGVVTRGAVVAERVPGGFAAVYRVLSAFEDAGRTRRGYFVSGLGAAQFGAPGAVDRLRSQVSDTSDAPVLTLAATDPANPYGAALAWPDREQAGHGHRPGRKAGALVVLHSGELAIYVEKGGRSLLTFTDDADVLADAGRDLACAVRAGALGRMNVQRADGEDVLTGADPVRIALQEAGFVLTPRGLRLRG